MSVVAPETLRERVRRYAARNDPTLAETLGYFQLDPSESSDERTLVENVLLGEREQPAASDVDDEQGGASA